MTRLPKNWKNKAIRFDDRKKCQEFKNLYIENTFKFFEVGKRDLELIIQRKWPLRRKCFFTIYLVDFQTV